VWTSVWIFDSRVQRTGDRDHHGTDREPLNRVTPHVDRTLLRIDMKVPLVGAEEVRRIVLDFRVLHEEGGQRGVGLQIRLVGQQRGVEPQHPRQRWRVLLEKPIEIVLGVLCRLGHRNRRNRCALSGFANGLRFLGGGSAYRNRQGGKHCGDNGYGSLHRNWLLHLFNTEDPAPG
jgi:hypothetical protein